MPTGYEEIDNLNNQVNQLYDKQLEQQQNIVNTSTQNTIDEIQRKQQEAQEEATKTNKALYNDYQKQINPYGVNAENLADQGLNKSGLAESTKANYYNTYQNARTQATNSANKIKADFDAQITQARQNGDLQMAQAALAMYQKQVENLYNTYNLKFNVDQFNYNKEQDALSQSNWEKQYEQSLQQAQWQQAFNQAQFDYQKQRDQVADEQWQKEYELSKKTKSSAGSGSSSSGYIGTVNDDNFQANVTNNDFLNDTNNTIDYIENTLRQVTTPENKEKLKQHLYTIGSVIDDQYNKEVITRNEMEQLRNRLYGLINS